jgi:MraZ protein
MPAPDDFILGEFPRTLDERFRLSLPPEFAERLVAERADCMLVKERAGCLSLWDAEGWQTRLNQGVQIVRAKMRAGKLEGRLGQVQILGRLLSTRHKPVQIADRGRLLIPEGFREFLQVEAGGDVMVVGAAVCIEIWAPKAWIDYVEGRIPRFRRLLDRLSS